MTDKLTNGKWDVSNVDNWTSSEFTLGAVGIEAGNSQDYITGGWRSNKPLWSENNCKQCLLCWIACPDSSITVEQEKMTGIDYDHCKGCGICALECKFEALQMVAESANAASTLSTTADRSNKGGDK